MTTSLTNRLDITPLGPHLGAEVRGLALQGATDADVVDLRAALVRYKVLFLAEQHGLDDDSHIELGRRIGEVTAAHPVINPLDAAHPEIYAIDSVDNGFADVWHTDVTFVKRPPLGSILRAVILPKTGGDTSWGDSQAAYDSLSPAVRRLADELTAVHDGNREFGYYLKFRRGGKGNEWDGATVSELVPVEHPVVRVHPETGRKGLFVNPGFTSHIAGVSDAESRHLLDLFYAHLTKPEHLVRHRWSVGDVVLWDNRSTVHYANRDYGTERRVMHRITIRGDVPVGPNGVGASRD